MKKKKTREMPWVVDVRGKLPDSIKRGPGDSGSSVLQRPNGQQHTDRQSEVRKSVEESPRHKRAHRGLLPSTQGKQSTPNYSAEQQEEKNSKKVAAVARRPHQPHTRTRQRKQRHQKAKSCALLSLTLYLVPVHLTATAAAAASLSASPTFASL